MNNRILSGLCSMMLLGTLSCCDDGQKLAEVEKAKQMEKAHLEIGQKWDQLGKSHAKDITVHWPDGRMTKGIDPHIKDLSGQFVFAPDTRIKEHPIRIASGEWTSVMGIMEGTFSRPMPIGDGKTIPPTGKPFKLMMVTIGHWKDGVMDEEWLLWDNQAFMKQIGLAH